MRIFGWKKKKESSTPEEKTTGAGDAAQKKEGSASGENTTGAEDAAPGRDSAAAQGAGENVTPRSFELTKKALDDRHFRYQVNQVDHTPVIYLWFPVKDGAQMVVILIFTGDHNGVVIHVPGIVKDIPREKETAVLRVINECYNRYRYIRLRIGENHCLDGLYDIPITLSDACVAGAVIESVVRMREIVDEIYPKFMKALWS